MTISPDFMARLAKTRGNPNAFSELVFGTPLHAGQTRFATSANAEVNFLLPGNSFGKTEFIGRFALYLAWFKISGETPTTYQEWLTQPYKGLIASYAYPIANESFERLVGYADSREEVSLLIQNINRANPSRIKLSNGASIDWGSLDGEGRLVEAARRRFIMVDEAGHIPDLSYTFDSILYPRTMGVGGRIYLLGTPKPHSDPYLWEVYLKGREGSNSFYYSQDGSVFENEFWSDKEKQRVLDNPRLVSGWRDCPHPVTPCDDHICQFTGGQHAILTQMGKQVILGHFITTGGLLFDRMSLHRLFSGEYPYVNESDNHKWVEPEPGHIYLGAFDLGGNRMKKKFKDGSDATVGIVVDYTTRPWKIVYYRYIEGGDMDWEQKYEEMLRVYKAYNMPYLLIDGTGTVDSVKEALQTRGIEVESIHFGGTGQKKYDMLRALQMALEMVDNGTKGYLRSFPVEQMLSELTKYALPDEHLPQDTVMALAMVVHHIMQWEVPEATGERWF